MTTISTDEPSLQPLPEGTRVDGYELRRWLSFGSCGDVYEAEQPRIGRSVALKLASPEAAGAAAAIAREVSLLARLGHPAIVPLVDGGTWQGRPYAVLAFAEGGPLERRCGRPWQSDAALRLLAPLAGALDAVHALGVVHRDVGARNVLLSAGGHPWLADFGTALLPGEPAYIHSERGDGSSDEGSDVVVTGTAPYVGPEIVHGERPSPASDRFAFAALAYQLLCGVTPVTGASREQVLALQVAGVVRSPSLINGVLPRAVDGVLLRGLAADPAARFASAGAFVAALAAALGSDPLGAGAAPLPDGTAALARAAAEPGLEEFTHVSGRLEAFLQTLPPQEQAALHVILRRAEAQVAAAGKDLQDLSDSSFAPAAALLALEETGAAALLAAQPRTAAELAQAGAGSAPLLRLLLDYLTRRGVVQREQGRYALPPSLRLLYDPGRGRQGTLRAGWRFWSHLPARVAGSPAAETMDSEDGAVYEGTVGVMAEIWKHDAEQAARMLIGDGLENRGLRVLDVGAGSGLWSRALALRDAEAHVTALDRPRVLELTRRYAAEAGTLERLACIVGDMHEAELPAHAFDLILLANVLHLEPGERIVPLLRRLRAALAPDGRLVVVDTMAARQDSASEAELLLSLQLALRTPAGKLHDAEEYAAWLREADFVPGPMQPIRAGSGGLSLLTAAAAPGAD